MRFEVTNRQFWRFVAETGYVTDPERAGHGHVWTDRWRAVDGADWLTLTDIAAQDGWQRQIVDLDAFAGHVVALRFVWRPASSRPADRWLIDRVAIELR